MAAIIFSSLALVLSVIALVVVVNRQSAKDQGSSCNCLNCSRLRDADTSIIGGLRRSFGRRNS